MLGGKVDYVFGLICVVSKQPALFLGVYSFVYSIPQVITTDINVMPVHY